MRDHFCRARAEYAPPATHARLHHLIGERRSARLRAPLHHLEPKVGSGRGISRARFSQFDPLGVEILKEPKNSLVRQYQTIMGFENVTLKFTDDALEAIAEEALKRNVGARGLKIIIEELMLDIMYTIPSQDAISECMITREVVDNRSQPITLYRKAG